MPATDPLHTAAIAGLAKTLRADPAVAAIVPDRVFTAPAEADGHLRCVLLTPGRALGPPPGPVSMKVQRDVKFECRAENPAVFEMLMNAVCKCLHRSGGGTGYQSVTHSDSGEMTDGDGFVSRTDTAQLVVEQPAAAVPDAPPPPARTSASPAVPVAPPPDRLVVPPAPPPAPKKP